MYSIKSINLEELEKKIPDIVSSESRFKIFSYLLARMRKMGPNHGAGTTKIANMMGTSINGAKKQLLHLKRYQIVDSRRMGRTRYWYLNLKNTEWILEVQEAFSKEYNVKLG